jgi:hypothetical protein
MTTAHLASSKGGHCNGNCLGFIVTDANIDLL